MFAVIRTGGKQYRVAPNDIIEVEKIAGKPGEIVELGEVILLGGEGGPKTGSPTIAGALVAAEVIEQQRSAKIIVFKKKALQLPPHEGSSPGADRAPHHRDPDRRQEAVQDGAEARAEG
jgi:large subunit ribosomal protein L21